MRGIPVSLVALILSKSPLTFQLWVCHGSGTDPLKRAVVYSCRQPQRSSWDHCLACIPACHAELFVHFHFLTNKISKVCLAFIIQSMKIYQPFHIFNGRFNNYSSSSPPPPPNFVTLFLFLGLTLSCVFCRMPGFGNLASKEGKAKS